MAVEKASSAVVSVMATETVRRFESPHDEFFRYFFGGQLPRENTNMGSGFIISEDGLVVTNQHVVGKNPSEIMVSTTDGASFKAKLIGVDELTDIALLRVESEATFPYVELSDSDDVIVGEWAIALGNPFGLFDDGNPTVTVGVVSAKNRDFNPDPNNPRVYIDMIQTDAAINRGNSGGPLLNSAGNVIGMNTFIYTGGTSAGFVGLSFAIPSNRIERVISQLLTSGVVMLDYDPGLEFTSMTEQLVYRYRLPYVQGLLVTSVNKNGPAFEGGIMPGDVIVRIGDERVVSEMHAWALLREFEVGDTMKVELIRDNSLYEAGIQLRQKVSGR
ncbi:MAG: PDZ domain-containing protein [Balneolaceae bacterium]|nr:MAG: PDZ domain-containing protein [Balneolaceae bacterium]